MKIFRMAWQKDKAMNPAGFFNSLLNTYDMQRRWR